MGTAKTPTREQPNIAVLVAARPPIIRDSFDLDDPVIFVER
jgi:hypothetical protein